MSEQKTKQAGSSGARHNLTITLNDDLHHRLAVAAMWEKKTPEQLIERAIPALVDCSFEDMAHSKPAVTRKGQ